MRIFIDESGDFGWVPPQISLHCAVIACNSSLVELFKRHLDWKTSILGPHRRREIKASELSDRQLEGFVRSVLQPERNIKLSVVGIDTRITPEEKLQEWRDSISHYCLGASEWSKSQSLHPAGRQYEEMSGWLWNRSPENLAQMISLSEIIARALQNAIVWFHESEFESEFDDFEIAIDQGFVRRPEHEVFWREFFRSYCQNRSRHDPLKTPQHWVESGHVFERRYHQDDDQLDLAPLLRDCTYFRDSRMSEGLQIADICAHICLRYHRRERWFPAYQNLRPFIVDVNRGPMTLLVPQGDGALELTTPTPTQAAALEFARRKALRPRRSSK